MAFNLSSQSNPLIVLDLANNHNGSVSHGKKIIDDIAAVSKNFDFKIAIKFQYRHLDSFIHPAFKGNFQYKYIKRFEETRLSISDFEKLITHAKNYNLLIACTPFDEVSVDLIEAQQFDFLKIASVSLTDWPLLNRIARTSLPVVASTAGSQLKDIDKVTSFLSKRLDQFALMHCVASYPTTDDNLQLDRISILKKRYPKIPIGYSTHENPKNLSAVQIAIAKGAEILERHVGSSDNNNQINNYSSEKTDLQNWLYAVTKSISMSQVGSNNAQNNTSEQETLKGLRRGAYAKHDIEAGELIKPTDIFYAIPLQENHLSANEFSLYKLFYCVSKVYGNGPILFDNVRIDDTRSSIEDISQKIIAMIETANLIVPSNLNLEISHHYGIENFNKFGMVLTTIVNRDYCKKLLFLSEGQTNPEHFHKIKEETFFCVFGDFEVVLDGASNLLSPGMSLTVPVGVRHLLRTNKGAIVEEISTKSVPSDSYYLDEEIAKNKNRKSFSTIWP